MRSTVQACLALQFDGCVETKVLTQLFLYFLNPLCPFNEYCSTQKNISETETRTLAAGSTGCHRLFARGVSALVRHRNPASHHTTDCPLVLCPARRRAGHSLLLPPQRQSGLCFHTMCTGAFRQHPNHRGVGVQRRTRAHLRHACLRERPTTHLRRNTPSLRSTASTSPRKDSTHPPHL